MVLLQKILEFAERLLYRYHMIPLALLKANHETPWKTTQRPSVVVLRSSENDHVCLLRLGLVSLGARHVLAGILAGILLTGALNAGCWM